MPSRYLTIGRITKPQGIRGEVIVTIDTDFPSRFFQQESFLLRTADEAPEPYEVEHVRPHKDRVVIKFRSINSRNDAEQLRNMEIVIPSEERFTEDEDFFYFDELEGMDVQEVDGRTIGRVTSVMIAPGRDVLVVDSNGTEVLIPFARDICVSVDREHRVIHVQMPDGLESLNR